jgi:AcrR family transcriptional regulator
MEFVTSEQRAVRSGRKSHLSRRAESDRRLIAAALKLIARQGVAGTSLAEIGLAAGYSRGLPSERFGSKAHFLQQLVDHMDRWFEAKLAGDLAAKTGLDAAVARLAAHFDGAIEGPLATRALYHLYIESLSVIPELKSRMAALSRAYLDGFAAHLREAKQLGQVGKDLDCEQQAGVILAAMRGMIIQSMLDPKSMDLRTAKKTLMQLFQQSLSATARM